MATSRRMYTFYSTNYRMYTFYNSPIECIHSTSLAVECIHSMTFYILYNIYNFMFFLLLKSFENHSRMKVTYYRKHTFCSNKSRYMYWRHAVECIGPWSRDQNVWGLIPAAGNVLKGWENYSFHTLFAWVPGG